MRSNPCGPPYILQFSCIPLKEAAGRVVRASDMQFGGLGFTCHSDRQQDLLIYKTFVELQNTTIIYCSKRN